MDKALEPPLRRAHRRPWFTLERRKMWFGVMIVTPGLLMVFATVLYPLGYGIMISFKKAHLLKLRKATWDGFGNYEKLFNDDLFWNALLNTIVMTGLWTIFGAALGLMFALALNRETRANRIIGGALLIPWIMPGVVIAYMCVFLFESRNGIMFETLTNLGIYPVRENVWTSLAYAKPTIIFITTWMAFPFFMVMFLAGLKTIPKEIVEAAEIDGANRIQSFLYITLPFLKNIIVIATTLSIIWGFNFLDIIYATTRGGPISSTETMAYLAWRMAFEVLDLGYTAALGVIWLLVLLVFSVFYLKSMKVI